MQPTPSLETKQDPFHPLIEVTRRYRSDVHELSIAASEDALQAAEDHLGHRLPPALGSFLRRWNGATLFRGALLVRGSAELASPRSDGLELVVFADGPGERAWAYAPDGADGWVFGELLDGELLPMHKSFNRWLEGTIRMLDEHVTGREEELMLRLECDPRSSWLLLFQGERLFESGETEEAAGLFQAATTANPDLSVAWQRLGRILLERNPESARNALKMALGSLKLPFPWSGARAGDPWLVRTLARLSEPDMEGLEEDLDAFLANRVLDVRSAQESEIHVAAALEVARARLRRGARQEAMGGLSRELERSRAFAHQGSLAELVLELSYVASDLGEHDEAERALREIRDHEDPEIRARGRLAVGRIAVLRHERWAEENLEEAFALAKDPLVRARARLLLAQRYLLNERSELAQQALEQARSLAQEAGNKVLLARVCITAGDLARVCGDMPAAEEAWRKGRGFALEAHDEETLLRVLVRRGDLHEAAGAMEESEQDHLKAAEGYRRLQLPIREAWALLRAARVGGNTDALDMARSRFMACDIAAGVAASDSLSGDPAMSLTWHMNRSTEHARARHEAQRARPPLQRSDAERPERRLESHRMAVASGHVGVVDELAVELNRYARQLESSKARALDPSVAGYIAAADLLASHRSYEAAVVLRDQLLKTRLPDIPSRALKGAITRSPNIALVDSLLGVIEGKESTHDISGVIEVLGWRREVAAVKELVVLASDTMPFTTRRAAIVALGRIGDRSAVDALLGALQDSRLAGEAAVALLLMGDRRGVDFHAQSLAAGNELDRAPGEIVGRYGGGSYLLLLRGIAEGDGLKALGALQGLGYLGDPRGVSVLLAALGRSDQVRVAVAAGALELLTGHHEDMDRPGLHACWEQWWERHEMGFSEGVRYRDGQVLTVDLLVEKLGHDDPLVRRGAYDELVVSTGCQLPFDADGPWRVQVRHRREWRKWCKEHGEQFPAGGWWFDGAAV